MKKLAFILAAVMLPCGAASAEDGQAANSNPIFPVPPNVTFLSGDTWNQGGTIVRLYGVQSCIRGTKVKVSAEKTTDCGEISMVYLAGLVKNTAPQCQGIAETTQPKQYLVVCKANVGGQQVDLGTALILSGFAFSAYNPDGTPTSMQYVVAEEQARNQKAGLWAFPDFPYPTAILMKAVKPREQ
ncbi:succinoglycan biosynthesis protein exoi [Brucella endophytica]|uniref:Succinoglycan biosynthesis protein exoi n=1 Tax=Brucella endophytica TaxID=1963359 RepID=A0A916SNR0_9HYPH|nr:thermonuclease family protein [Brucella endophytica]GGB09326.1 succinoglycan biosynthesis protein exoi [Brucella endophytica]